MFDKVSVENYKDNILGVRKALPEILRIFEDYQIFATWATVGFLFAENRSELMDNIPQTAPNYKHTELSSYEHMKKIGRNELDDPYHFGSSLIDLIQKTAYQEIGSHTFSHYYCLEDGQTKKDFEEDLKAFIRITKGAEVSSIVFPRNQVNEEYCDSCISYGIKVYRGTEKAKIYSAATEEEKTELKYRALRLADSYFNIFGHNTYRQEAVEFKKGLVNLPASRFLRPYFNKLRFLEKMKMKRILDDMTYAAKNKEIYHLWWHPHNSGNNIEENLKQIELIAKHYKFLNENYDWESSNMKSMASIIIDPDRTSI